MAANLDPPISLLVVRWITQPLRHPAKAAEDFSKGTAPVPLTESGPREVQEAARTFNAMQARIHRLVADRTQALAAVSHDLRSPIQRLRLRADFLDHVEAQRAIDDDLDEMEAMIGSPLAYLRGETESEEPRQTDLTAILATLVDDAPDRGATATYAEPDRLPMQLRPVGIKRALANLVDNAVKHGAGHASLSRRGRDPSRCGSRTTGPAFRRRRWRRCSNCFSALTLPATGTPAAPGSASPSPAMW
ncbi:HAMP domain-containing protein [Belnapia sp. T18]|uniref:histidine kinase n=1 Tax=Belnapia arida TaxID=2804533 RepID=A0ABS1U814_9PROT|nr:HAMP domain-containing protein [Belnapia arida]MBL6080808.1 HAMP domain-containing protein [Belnapia arida]